MIGKLYERVGNSDVLLPTENALDIEIIKEINENIFPDNNKIFSYIHCKVSLNPLDNPFAEFEEDKKDREIQKYLNIDVDEDDSLIQEAIKLTEKSYSTPTYRSYKSIKKLLDRINTDIETMSDVELNYEQGGNASGIMGVVKNMALLRKELQTAKKDFMAEQGEVRGRGATDFAYDEFDKDNLE